MFSKSFLTVPGEHKTFAYYIYNAGPTLKSLEWFSKDSVGLSIDGMQNHSNKQLRSNRSPWH